MAGDYHLQANVDMRALAILARARLDSGEGVRSLAQLAKDVIEQAAIELIELGAETVEYSEEAQEILQRMGLLRPSGTNRKGNFNEHLRAVGEQTGFASLRKDLDDKQQRRDRDSTRRGRNEPNPDLMQAAWEAAERLREPLKEGLTSKDRERIAQAPHLLAQISERSEDANVDDHQSDDVHETLEQALLRRKLEAKEALQTLRDTGEAPLTKSEDYQV